MLETKAPVLIDDVPAWEARRGRGAFVDVGEPPLSMLTAPLVSGDEVRGRISLQNVDRKNAFTESDVRLLTTLAGSLSVALENARLVHETRQRNAELALINSVQDAIAGELDPQAIYDIVGDRIQEVFDAQAVDIAISTTRRGVAALPVSDRARRAVAGEPRYCHPLQAGTARDQEPLTDQRGRRPASRTGSEQSVVVGRASQVGAVRAARPGGQVRGRDLAPERRPRERVLGDRPAAAGDARRQPQRRARNARLVHETRQRNAELALINSVQAAIAGELDPQAIYDIVGDRIQEIFDAQVVDISIFDEARVLRSRT